MSTHKKLSFIKSFIRMLGYVGLSVAFGDNVAGFIAAWVLVGSEVLGIVEEIGEK